MRTVIIPMAGMGTRYQGASHPKVLVPVKPDGDPMFIHTAEGDDDMPAHIRTALTTVNLSIPVSAGRLALGTWQGVYLWEHRKASHSRKITAHFIGE